MKVAAAVAVLYVVLACAPSAARCTGEVVGPALVCRPAARTVWFHGWAGHQAVLVDAATGRVHSEWIGAPTEQVCLPWSAPGLILVTIGNVTYLLSERDALWD